MNHLQSLAARYGMREARAIYMLVMEQRFGLTVTQVLLGKDRELSADERHELDIITARLLEGEPVQYVLGECSFRGHDFHVEPGVLIPRPETAQLVALIVQEAQPGLRVLDIGTGSGCIGVSLALEGMLVTALDISPDALRIASANATRMQADVQFVQGDILHPTACSHMWDIIVSNPPYIRHCEAADMNVNVLEHEPHTALFVPDDDPLLFYRAIGRFAQEHLTAKGTLWLEINRDFPQQTCHLLEGMGYAQVQAMQDSYGNYRFVKAIHT